MPGFDGTGPAGLGPMTGRGQGYCVLERVRKGGRDRLVGFAGVDSGPVEIPLDTVRGYGKEGMNVPEGDATGPLGLGPMTGRAAGYCAGYPVPGFMNPSVVSRPGRGLPFCGAPGYGYGTGFAPSRGALGRGFGRGRGRWRGPQFGRYCR